MEYERQLEELTKMEQWDPDALVDALGITTEELLAIGMFYGRAIEWIEENVGE